MVIIIPKALFSAIAYAQYQLIMNVHLDSGFEHFHKKAFENGKAFCTAAMISASVELTS